MNYAPKVVHVNRTNSRPDNSTVSPEEMHRKGDEIYTLLYSSSRSTENIVFFLYNLLQGRAIPAHFETICKQQLTPWLVQYLKHVPRAMKTIRTESAVIMATFDATGLERVMISLKGQYRQAARYFLNAINQRIPEDEICAALHPILHEPVKIEQDPDAVNATPDQREAAICQLINYRDDRTPSQIFFFLFTSADTLKREGAWPQGYDYSINQINLRLIQCLLQIDKHIIDEIKQELSRDPASHNYTVVAAQLHSLVTVSTDDPSPACTETVSTQKPAMDLRELLLRMNSCS